MHWLEAYAAPQQPVFLGGRRFNLKVAGDGEPTVVLAAGYLGGTLDWVLVQQALARRRRVVSFDNAGLGFSDPAAGPRDTRAIVADLRNALVAASLGPPYILVGHSAGSLRMRLFAALHPDDVAGLVLVDPVTCDWEARLYGGPSPGMEAEVALFARFLERARRGLLRPDDTEFRQRVGFPRPDFPGALNDALISMWLSPSYLETAILEARGIHSASDDAIAADGPLGDVPTIVLSAGRIGQSPITGGDPDRVATWFAMHDEIAARSSRGRRELVDAGHNIPIEAPASVVHAVNALLPVG